MTIMSKTHKPIAEQVIVITGASSGIGLATAELATGKGATVVLAARSAKTLDDIAFRLNSCNGKAVAVPCDVSLREDMEKVVHVALQQFGRIDTWVNNAGLGMWGRLDETEDDEARRLFDINFWGVVNGSLAALPHLKQSGGVLINVGSEVSDAYPALLGMYACTKHAVKGYTDALRVEIEEIDQAPVSICLIQPQAVDTPFPQHARNFTDREPMLPKPMIEPHEVAEAILAAAVTPSKHVKVGPMSLVNTATAKLIPGMADKMSARQANHVHYDELPRKPHGALHRSSEEIQMAGRTHGIGGREPAE